MMKPAKPPEMAGSLSESLMLPRKLPPSLLGALAVEEGVGEARGIREGISRVVLVEVVVGTGVDEWSAVDGALAEGVGAAEAGEAQAGPVQVAWDEAEGKREAEGRRDAESSAVLVEERLGQLLGEAVRESVPVAAKEGSETVEVAEGEWSIERRAESV
jgi:hypothetical protein